MKSGFSNLEYFRPLKVLLFLFNPRRLPFVRVIYSITFLNIAASIIFLFKSFDVS